MSIEHLLQQSLSAVPPVRWDAVEQGEHIAQFYENGDFLVAAVSEYIGSALDRGEVGIVIGTETHRRGIEERLAARGCDLVAARQSGLYVALDATETLGRFMVGGWPDERRFVEVVGSVIVAASERGATGTRAFGEMVALLAADGEWDAAVRLEQLWNHLGKIHRFSLLCGYPLKTFRYETHGRSFLEVCSEHSHVLPAESYSGLTDPHDRLRAISRLQQMAGALETETAEKRQIERTLANREVELADFLENAVEGLHKIGPDGTILWANQALLELLGYSEREYVGHKAATFHVHPETFTELWRKLMDRAQVYDWPAELRCKDGSTRHVLIHSNGLWEDERFLYTRCFIRDVTERRHLEEELVSRVDELAELGRRKDEFLAMLAHELRNPLSPIVTALHLMRQCGDDRAGAARAREIIERQIRLMTRLVEDLLDVARITRGKIELREERVLLAPVVERAIELARPMIDERAHRLMVELPEQPVSFVADGARLEQIFSNLLHNAAKYTEVGGKIEFRAWQEGGQIVVSVRDNGLGLSSELRGQVFDLFVQGRNPASVTNGGLGIGLTLVRQLAELHGGSVEARSEGAGRGSEFVVRLPLRTEVAEPANGKGGNGHAEPLSAPSQTRRILVVDDNRDAAKSLGDLLRVFGHQVRVAHGGAIAIEEARRFRPEIVILDIGMPEMDGYEVAQRLRADGAPAVLVALTGYGQERDRQRSKQAGFDHHLAKPVDIAQLKTLLATAL